MQSFIQRFTARHLMNVKYDVDYRKAVDLFFLEKTLRSLKINDMSFYLLKRLIILSLIIYLQQTSTDIFK